jgi:hypothetical protein
MRNHHYKIFIITFREKLETSYMSSNRKTFKYLDLEDCHVAIKSEKSDCNEDYLSTWKRHRHTHKHTHMLKASIK